MGRKKSTKKQEIDTTIINSIKAVVEFLNIVGQIDEPDSKEILEKLKNSNIKSFKPFYEGNEHLQLIDLVRFLGSQDLSNIRDNKKKQEMLGRQLLEKISTPEMIVYTAFQTLNFVCCLINKKSLRILYDEARNGNQKSLLTLLRYDKTLFDHEWFRELIMRKMIEGNYYFFEKIGDAIKSEPPLGRQKRGKLKIVLLMFWHSVFKKLTWNERLNLLDKFGLTDIPGKKEKMDVDALKHLVRTGIIPQFK